MSWLFLETVTPCPACSRRRPLDGVVLSVTCFCGAPPRQVGAATWKLVVEMAPIYVPNLEEPQDFDITEVIYGKWGPGAPRCSGCDAELLAAHAALPAAGPLPCPSCGMAHRLAELPEEVEAGATRMLLAAEPTADAKLAAKEQGSTFPCPHCGGELAVDGSERTLACTYCSASAYVPDELWGRLQGTILPKRWYLWTAE